MCRSMVDIQSPTAEIRRGKKKKKKNERNRMKIYMVSLLHRATINKPTLCTDDITVIQWCRQDLVRGARHKLGYMKLFVAHKMTRNNTLNRVHVAATELTQLLSQNTNTFGEATEQTR